MTYLMIGNDLSLFLAHDPVFLLFSYKDNLNRLKQIFLTYDLSSVLHGIDRRFIDHIRKIRTDRP